MLQMSFEDCSVIGIKTELYLFASWEKFRMVCCLAEATESFC